MNLKDDLLRGLHAYHYEQPMVLQKLSIRPILEGKNVVMQASSGMGKTASYVIAVLQSIDISVKHCQALILAPTRELAGAITYSMIRPIAQFIQDLKINEIVAHADIHEQTRMLREDGSQVLVATPGRMWDLYQRHAVDFSHIQFFILESLGEILSNGSNHHQIYDFVRVMPEHVQFAVISSFPSSEVDRFISQCLPRENTVRITLKDRNLTLVRTRHFYIDTSDEEHLHLQQQQGEPQLEENASEDGEKRKFLAFEDFLDTYSMPAHVLIYCANALRVEWLTTRMKERCFPVESISHEQSHEARCLNISQFKNGAYRYLVTTELSGQLPCDVFPPCLVINYDWPRYREQYLRRIGRYHYRNERNTICINFLSMKNESERKLMQSISDLYDVNFEEMPSNEDTVC
jgi:translation initiation factor 4A